MLVIVIHSASQDLYTSSPHWWISVVADAFSRCCVPLFFMLSGALLIKPDIDITTFINKRVARILPPLFFWGVAYIFFNRYYWGWIQEFNISDFIKIFYTNSYIHMWYLYDIVGLYLFIPVISKWYINSEMKEKTIYVSIIFICNCLLQITDAFPVLSLYGMNAFLSYMCYFIIGAYLLELYERNKFKRGLFFYALAYVLICICIAFITWIISKINGKATFEHLNYNNPLIAISAAFAFISLIKLKKTISIVSLISNLSLGIYCIHMMWLAPVNKFLSGINLYYPIRLMIMIISVMALSAISIYVLRKVKLFRYVT